MHATTAIFIRTVREDRQGPSQTTASTFESFGSCKSGARHPVDHARQHGKTRKMQEKSMRANTTGPTDDDSGDGDLGFRV